VLSRKEVPVACAPIRRSLLEHPRLAASFCDSVAYLTAMETLGKWALHPSFVSDWR